MSKPTLCICENSVAYQRLCIVKFLYFPNPKFQQFKPLAIFCHCTSLSETPLTGFFHGVAHLYLFSVCVDGSKGWSIKTETYASCKHARVMYTPFTPNFYNSKTGVYRGIMQKVVKIIIFR